MKMNPVWIILVVVGIAALAYNVLVKEGETVSLENEIRIGFIVLLVGAGAYELWKRSRTSK